MNNFLFDYENEVEAGREVYIHNAIIGFKSYQFQLTRNPLLIRHDFDYLVQKLTVQDMIPPDNAVLYTFLDFNGGRYE